MGINPQLKNQIPLLAPPCSLLIYSYTCSDEGRDSVEKWKIAEFVVVFFWLLVLVSSDTWVVGE